MPPDAVISCAATTASQEGPDPFYTSSARGGKQEELWELTNLTKAVFVTRDGPLQLAYTVIRRV